MESNEAIELLLEIHRNILFISDDWSDSFDKGVNVDTIIADTEELIGIVSGRQRGQILSKDEFAKLLKAYRGLCESNASDIEGPNGFIEDTCNALEETIVSL